jgi:glyoxylase-like metal-dependent hydrolase (beta-lactamase superfamily II)
VQITSHVSLVGGGEESDPADAAVYLIAADGEAALVDAGTGRGTARVLANLQRAGVEPRAVKHLFLTHCHYDHTGGAAALRDATGGLVVAHALDAAYLEAGDSRVTAASWYGARMTPLPIDVKVTGAEQRFTVGTLEVTFRHAPGHSPGSSVLTLESDGKLVLFGQDVHGPLDPALCSVRADYERSLQMLLALGADILCEGHFGVLRGQDEVRDFIESYL